MFTFQININILKLTFDIFKQVLKCSLKSLDEYTAGHVMNLAATDVEVIYKVSVSSTRSAGLYSRSVGGNLQG